MEAAILKLNASAEDLEEDAKAQWKKVDELESLDQADQVLSHIPNSDRWLGQYSRLLIICKCGHSFVDSKFGVSQLVAIVDAGHYSFFWLPGSAKQ